MDRPVHPNPSSVSQQQQMPATMGNEKRHVDSSIESHPGSDGEETEQWKAGKQELIIMGTMAVLAIVVSVSPIHHDLGLSVPHAGSLLLLTIYLVGRHHSGSCPTRESNPLRRCLHT
jgi:hypothetical protein